MLPTLYQNYIHLSRYSRWREQDNRRETWNETVTRYMSFFRKHLKQHFDYKIPDALYFQVFDYIFEQKAVPSMRALASAGEFLEQDNCAGYNCSYTAIDEIIVFDEILYILLCRTGVGFSVEKKYVSQLPDVPETLYTNSLWDKLRFTANSIFKKFTIPRFYKFNKVHVVQDSRIGWCNAFRYLIFSLYNGLIPDFDFSKIRDAGSYLKTSGGRAAGADPLKKLFAYTIALFREAQGRKLTTQECHDLVCAIGAVVQICSRRAALISLSDLEDEEIRHCKQGEYWHIEPNRALANNSAVYNEKPPLEIFLSEWLALIKSKSGERGIANRKTFVEKCKEIGRKFEGIDFGLNPCQPAWATVLTPNGISTIGQIKERDSIWSKEGWTTVLKKWSTGIKKVYEYKTEACTFYGTENHRIVCQGEKIPVKDAEYIDICREPSTLNVSIDKQKQTFKIKSRNFVSEEEVFDITVDNQSHTYWSGGCDVSNCGEIILRPKQFCNLSEVVVREKDDVDSLTKKIEVTTILGTWQSTLTNFRYLSDKWRKNSEEERLLGVSLTGVYDNPLTYRLGNELYDLQKRLRDKAREINKKWAKILGIQESAAITCNKPSGNTSQFCDCSSGLHPRYSEYYLRSVRQSKLDPLCRFMIDAGFPHEDCKVNPESTMIFSFPQQAPEHSVKSEQITAIDQLELWKSYQKNYCDHNPSVSIYVKDEEWLTVGDWVYRNFDCVGGLSFFPFVNVFKDRQPPYWHLTREEYLQLSSKMPKDVNWEKLKDYEANDNTSASSEIACSGGSCEL